MSENLRTYLRGVYVFDAVARRVPADAWDHPSPCEEWTAKEVLGHVVWGVTNVASGASGGPAPAATPEAETAGDDPLGAWERALSAVTAALDTQGALQREMDSPFGRLPIDAGLSIFVNDLTLHAWDLARAAGIHHGIPDELAERALSGIAGAGDAIRRPGIFGPEQSAPDGADIVERMAAMAGRSV